MAGLLDAAAHDRLGGIVRFGQPGLGHGQFRAGGLEGVVDRWWRIG